jgi:hypothetical protein
MLATQGAGIEERIFHQGEKISGSVFKAAAKRPDACVSASGLFILSGASFLSADLTAHAASSADGLASANGFHSCPEAALALLFYLADTMIFHSTSPANFGFIRDGGPSGDSQETSRRQPKATIRKGVL